MLSGYTHNIINLSDTENLVTVMWANEQFDPNHPDTFLKEWFIIDSSSFPLVSVIIPVYNVRPYLNECFDSVINQTYKNLEIIVIDDGSNDGSEKVCDIYQKKDDRIRVIHQNNHGLSNARNTGLDVMKGDIVAFLDSDDAFLPKMIETMVEEMNSTNCDMVVCGYYVCNTTKHMVASKHSSIFKLQRKVLSSKEALRNMVNETINVTVWNKIYRRQLFEKLRFSEDHVYEDRIIMPFLFEHAHSILLLDQTLLIYRIRPRSITSIYSEKSMLDWLYARKIVEKFIAERTPSVFSLEERYQCLEKDFLHLINDYLKLLNNSNSITYNTQVIFENDIRGKLKYLPCFGLKTRLLYYTYKHNPQISFFILRGNDCIITLSSKIKVFVQRSFNK